MTTVGRYRIVREIGEGGFGVVYLAEQTEPVRREVALKILKAGMDTQQVVARFEAERQALALMDHANIAKVLDAGATAEGRPYFVMERVEGLPITRHCDEAGLDTRARLELFRQVCHGVQHAHSKGIIHRDLKPSNVLVTARDGVPKIIDFGIAKAIDRPLTEKTLFTEFRQMVGTPEYMAPEQAEMSGLDIDTRADVYSLGVLLYELLTGSKPFDLATLLEQGYEEILRTIREVDPPRPSTRASTSGAVAAGERGPLARRLKGDLDWIVMKALEKDRARRYATAHGLAADIQRHLEHEPVLAGPPGPVYRARKYVRRHRLGAAVAAAALAALLAGFAVAVKGYVEAAAQHERARRSLAEAAREAGAAEDARAREAELRRHAEEEEQQARTDARRGRALVRIVQEMLSAADPHAPRGPDCTVGRLLDDFSKELKGRLAGEPEVEATIRTTIGRAYLAMGRPDKAEPHLARARALREG